MATRNLGAGTRSMAAAGRVFLNRAVEQGEIAFATAHSVDLCWKKFARFAHSRAVRRIEHVTRALVLDFGRELAVEVKRGDCAPGYAQRLVSGVNTILRLSGANWEPVKPVADCQIPCRSHVRKSGPGGMEAGTISIVIAALQQVGLHRAAAVVILAWGFGLRSKEASLLDTVKALRAAEQGGQFTLAAGTKGGRQRVIRVRHPYQMKLLEQVAAVQGSGRSIIPSELDWRQFRDDELMNARPILKKHGVRHFHDLRAAYACRRYQELTGHAAPVILGKVSAKGLDRATRLIISQELGHNRIEVSAAYVGGMS